MSHANPCVQGYLREVAHLARHVMDLHHQGKTQAAAIQEHRLSGLISAAMTLKPDWHEPLLGLHKVVFEYSLRPCRSISPDAYLMHRHSFSAKH